MGVTFRALASVLGWLLLALAVDVGLGLGLQALRPQDEPTPPVAAPAVDLATTATTDPVALSRRCVGNAEVPERHRQWLDAPAYDGAPWIEEFWCEFGRLQNRYVPFLLAQSQDTSQQLINITNGVRGSYRPAGTDDGTPVIWFFGGSTMWGWGQRDDHTIPSEVARLSEAAGTPVRVLNFGALAWVHWQEVLAFEQALAHRPAADLVVFYDGVNDANVQVPDSPESRPSDHPTIYDFGDDPSPPLAPVLGVTPAPPDRPSLLEQWADRSAVARLAAGLGGVVGLVPPPAAADDTASDEAFVRRTLEVYERGRSMANDLAERYSVEPHFYWQPRLANVGDDAFARSAQARISAQTRDRERSLVAGITAPTVDLSGVFDNQDPDDLFTDDAHTDEEGARLVAEAIWRDLQPSIRRLYASGDGGDPGVGA